MVYAGTACSFDDVSETLDLPWSLVGPNHPSMHGDNAIETIQVCCPSYMTLPRTA